MFLSTSSRQVTVFVGCGFAAKYRLGGGNFSVPLQWTLGLKRLGIEPVWLELMPATKDPAADQACIRAFQRRLAQHGLARNYCLLYHNPPEDRHDLEKMTCHGLSLRELERRLAGPNILLNISYTFHPPFLMRFERRVYCDIDPGEITYWMARLEMGQSYHHDFWTIGLNKNAPDCGLPSIQGVKWKTFFPLVDTTLNQPRPRPRSPRFTTVGQWYWTQGIEVNGEYPDLSKQHFFSPYMTLPSRAPEARMEMAMNLNPDDPEIERIRSFGWWVVPPHRVVASPALYRRYIGGSLAEFTTCKGVDCLWRTGWVSDRAATYLATGRPVVTEDTGIRRYLPDESGMLFFSNPDEAADAVRRVMRDWDRLSKAARSCAAECFDAAKNLRRILADQGLGKG
ncbi:MAG: hypothetical protein PHV34_05205 [Verrucomicrobiae bacterium]|nr:hypothetical protein [Verrucomicrobiae bacterium]